jgi:hypothetical protein
MTISQLQQPGCNTPTHISTLQEQARGTQGIAPVGDCNDAVCADEARLEAVHVRAADRVVQVKLQGTGNTVTEVDNVPTTW